MATKTVSSKIKKYTTLAEVEAQTKGPLYVLNATTGALKGRLMFNIPKANGQGYDLIRVPLTFIPVDVTEEAPRDRIIHSTEFRATLGKGLIKLPTPEYARLLLDSPEGREELERVRNERLAVDAVNKNMNLRDDAEDEYVDVKNVGAKAKAAAESGDEPAAVSVINFKLKNMVAEANEDDWGETKIVAFLRTYGDLNKREVKFLYNKFKTMPRVLKYLKAANEALENA